MTKNYVNLFILLLISLVNLPGLSAHQDIQKGWSHGLDVRLHQFFINYGAMQDTLRVLEKYNLLDEKNELAQIVTTLEQALFEFKNNNNSISFKGINFRNLDDVTNELASNNVEDVQLPAYDYGNFELSIDLEVIMNDGLALVNAFKNNTDFGSAIKDALNYRQIIMELIKTEYDFIHQCHELIDVDVFIDAVEQYQRFKNVSEKVLDVEGAYKFLQSANQYKQLQHVLPVALLEMLSFARDPAYGKVFIERAYSKTMIDNVQGPAMAEILKRYLPLSKLISDILSLHKDQENDFDLGEKAFPLSQISLYAVAPVQRQPRYKMLADEIQKNFLKVSIFFTEDERTATLAILERSQEIAGQVARLVDSTQGTIEAIQKNIAALQEKLSPNAASQNSADAFMLMSLIEPDLLPKAKQRTTLSQLPIVNYEYSNLSALEITEFYRQEPVVLEKHTSLKNSRIEERQKEISEKAGALEEVESKIREANKNTAIKFYQETDVSLDKLITKLISKKNDKNAEQKIEVLNMLKLLVFSQINYIKFGQDGLSGDPLYGNLIRKQGGIGIGIHFENLIKQENKLWSISFTKKALTEEEEILSKWRKAYKDKTNIFFKVITTLKRQEEMNNGIRALNEHR